jgi:hypothetical protein
MHAHRQSTQSSTLACAQAEHSIKHTCMRTSGALNQRHMQARKQAHPSARRTCVFHIIDRRTEQKQNISQRQAPTYVFVTGATGTLCRTSQDTSSVKAQAPKQLERQQNQAPKHFPNSMCTHVHPQSKVNTARWVHMNIGARPWNTKEHCATLPLASD